MAISKKDVAAISAAVIVRASGQNGVTKSKTSGVYEDMAKLEKRISELEKRIDDLTSTTGASKQKPGPGKK